MIKNVHMYLYLLLILIIFYLFVHTHILKKDVLIKDIEIRSLMQNIANLEKESLRHIEKMSLASKKASEAVREDILESDSILNKNVPRNCEDAMMWGIKQAYKL